MATTTDPLRVLVVADDPLARAGLASLLAAQPGCTIVGQTGTAADLGTELAVYRPDAIVWDLGWAPGGSPARWLSATGLREGRPLLVLLPDEQPAQAIWAAGARGLLRRDAPACTILAALQALAEGLAVFDPALADALLPLRERVVEPPVETLTPRESEVLQLVADGLSNKGIAAALGISEHTVKFHLNALMGKLGAQSRTDAVVRATRLGLIIL